MGSLVLYIIEWAFGLLVFLAIYKAVFSGATFYRFNRFYLLGATLLSALLPLVHVSIPDSHPFVNNLSIQETGFAQELSGTFTVFDEPDMVTADSSVTERKTSFWAVMMIVTYSVYVLTLLIGWSRGIIKVRRFLSGKTRRRLGHKLWLVTHNEAYGPFSWLNYIVISDTESGFARRASLRHEYSHVKLLHSLDLIFLLACTIVNPVCWLVLQEIKIVHEYEADDEVINRYGILDTDYQKLLIMKAAGAEAYALASSFNLNIKKRIIMMNKKKTLKRRLMWLLLLLPMVGMTSVLFARTEKTIGQDDSSALKQSDPQPVWEDDAVESAFMNPYGVIDVAEIGQRNVMSIMVNKNDEIYVHSGAVNRVIDLSELKGLASQFIANPGKESNLPAVKEYEINGYKTVQTTTNHIIALQCDRTSSVSVMLEIRASLSAAYKELRDEWCRKEFGQPYDRCSETEQRYSRLMYPTRIHEALPKQYGGSEPQFASTLVLKLRTDGIEASIKELAAQTSQSFTDPGSLKDYLARYESQGISIRTVELMAYPDITNGLMTDVKTLLRENGHQYNIKYIKAEN